MIGLSKRAGKLVSGSYAVEESIRLGKTHLVIISEEASSNTIKKFFDMCKYRDIDIIKIGSMEALGKSIGKPNRAVVAIMDIAFKDMILDALPSAISKMGVID